MTARHFEVKSLFLEACELTVHERGPFLDGVCGSDEVRQEVEALLAYHDQAVREVEPSEGPALRSKTPLRTRPIERFETGELFAGRYRIVSELGQGGMGQVFRAHDLSVDQEVAVKFLPSIDARRIDLLRREVRLSRQVTHVNVCRVFDFGEAEGETFLTMEYVDGEDLSSLLGRIGRLPQSKLLDIAHQLCAGLSAAHSQGVLHRDLKPANVMIDGRGKVRITDFGIATSMASDEDRGLVIGTPAYMAPEQWASGQATVQSDLYALGLLLHEMSTGEPVFRAETPAEYAQLHQHKTPETALLGHLDERLESVIRQCLEKIPSDRPASALAVAAALPGGDRLQQALDSGETPSPELVAAAGREAGVKQPNVVAMVCFLALVMACLVLTGDRAFPSRGPWAEDSPQVLVRRAGEVLEQLGHDLRVVDRAWGFRLDYSPPVGTTDHHFWYRQAGKNLVPSSIDMLDVATQVSYYDPAPIDVGMVQMLLDSEGRVVTLKVTPVRPDGTAEGDALDFSAPVDWQPALQAAGFGDVALTEIAPIAIPPMFAQIRRAWKSAEPPARIEAAALGGRVVYLNVRNEEMDPQASFEEWLDGLWGWYLLILNSSFVILTLGIVVVARANLQAGRGDLRGARRLAITVLIVQLILWLLASDHFGDLYVEATRLMQASARSLLKAGLVWLSYLAIEPLVRRQTPHLLIAWSRLWRGRWKDPQVGQAVLFGITSGACWALLIQLDRLLVDSFGLKLTGVELLVQEHLNTALTGRQLLARILESGIHGIYWGLIGMFCLAILKLLLRRRALAMIVFVALFADRGMMVFGVHPIVSWLAIGLGIAATSVWLLQNHGLLTYVVALFSQRLLTHSPITSMVDSWYATTSVFTLGMLVVLALLAAHTTLSGRPLVAAWLGSD